MIRVVYTILGLILGFAITLIAAYAVAQNGEERRYGEVIPYDAETPLPVPPLSFFAIGVENNDALLARVVQYCSSDTERLQVWFEETHPERLAALCGMYIAATNAPYHEQPNPPTNALMFARQQSMHCGTVVIAQGEIYSALGLTWRYRQNSNHGWIEVQIDAKWEVFDATVNVWYAGENRRRMFWIPDYPGAFDHERYCYAWGCYNMRSLRRDVYEGNIEHPITP